ncbi:Uncharacterized protein PECH_001566 [Penicillium ucsense]|uniref:Uncharacterized protein n=1 Tax=Penicillium ucsense TaxID=2839758 RepID=A0A8J8VXB4_9EURO|nr:Uncharacterized protein PECM_001082 [Penicillium ucsense]KAF7732639.1 Uncharacterized protein PECH_001566 [Penicillium ucsense]
MYAAKATSVFRSLLTTLGLRSAPDGRIPNRAASLLLANWVIAYLWMSTRYAKIALGIDNNIAPREDLATIGEAAVQSGKISRRKLDKLKRDEAAHANAIENYSVFAAAILIAVIAKVPNKAVNRYGLWYTASRIAFSFCYSYGETRMMSNFRSAFWWSGNISCICAFVAAAKNL